MAQKGGLAQTGSSARTGSLAQTDRALAGRVKEALLRNTESSGIDVKVECQNGVIQLSGIVDVLADKVVAEQIAWRVPGVKDVENGLTVAMDGRFDDKHIEKELVDRLSHNQDTTSIGVRVSEGIVTLLGEVENLAQAKAALREAQGTRGVKDVLSELALSEDVPDAATVVNEVERTLAGSDIGADDIKTSTEDGVVTLAGWVRDLESMERVEDLVSGIRGVRAIENNLEVRTSG